MSDLVDAYRRAGCAYPVFANLRNGLWYGKNWDGTCYFKSTDGHSGRYGFYPDNVPNPGIWTCVMKYVGYLPLASIQRGRCERGRYLRPKRVVISCVELRGTLRKV